MIRDFSVIRRLFGQKLNIYAACLCRVQVLFLFTVQLVHVIVRATLISSVSIIELGQTIPSL